MMVTGKAEFVRFRKQTIKMIRTGTGKSPCAGPVLCKAFCLMTLLVIMLEALCCHSHQMKSDSHVSMASVHAQISQRIDESKRSWNHWHACAGILCSPEIPPIEKVRKLTTVTFLGYIMTCCVDAEITAYSDGSGAGKALQAEITCSACFLRTDTGHRQLWPGGADGGHLTIYSGCPAVRPAERYYGPSVLRHLF